MSSPSSMERWSKKKKCLKKWGWGEEKVTPVLDHRSEYTRRQQLLALEFWLLREKLE